tara:strand:+ start:245 stop:460 length:216 start_codon:yes stop_codon:yes gene_type:complete
MTKLEFDKYFKMEILPIIADKYEKDGIPDRPARREAYNNETDYFCKDGQITEKQYNEWFITDSLETTLYWL